MGIQLPRKKAQSPTQFLAHVGLYCGQTAGWMKTPLGTEVDLGPGYIVLDGDPAAPRKGHSSPLFSAHVYCGHSRPSQLLLSCCYTAHRIVSLYLTMGRPFPPENCPFHSSDRGIWNNPNGISIGSAVFAELSSVTDLQTDGPRYSVGN